MSLITQLSKNYSYTIKLQLKYSFIFLRLFHPINTELKIFDLQKQKKQKNENKIEMNNTMNRRKNVSCFRIFYDYKISAIFLATFPIFGGMIFLAVSIGMMRSEKEYFDVFEPFQLNCSVNLPSFH